MHSVNGRTKVNFREIARDLGICAMTLYRVVNNEPGVKRETRARVIDALNRHGYFTHCPQKDIKVFFDFTDHAYLRHYGSLLMNNIGKLNYTCFATDHRKNPRQFADIAAICDVGVFASVPDEDTIDKARMANPDIYTITLSTQSNADVTLSPDNVRGGELAARHFHALGHRHIAVHLAAAHPTRMVRYKAFFAEMKLLDPDCRIDVIYQELNEDTVVTLRNYFQHTVPAAGALFFLAGAFAEEYLNGLLRPHPEIFGNISVMTFDRPQDLEFTELHYRFDRLEFVSRDLLDWAEYYITNRPMMKKRSPIHTSINIHLVVEGSVRNMVNDNSTGA